MSATVIHLIPHTHWDREWYLPLGAFRARLVPALDWALDLLEADQRITSFLLDGQTVLLEDYLEIRPEQRARVQALVAAERLQVGPWYVLADEQVPAGESLVRNLLLGGAAARELGGVLPVLYSPDAFGHPECLPALAQEFGIHYGILWRGVGAEPTGGRDLFWWESPDGQRILVYHLPPDGYEIGSNLLVPAERLPDAWQRVAKAVLSRAATGQVAVFVGADHHAIQPDLGGLASALTAAAPNLEFRFSRVDKFLQSAAQESSEVAILRGEQRWSYGYTWTLQGVHATRAPLKRRNSGLELALLRTAEPLVALTAERSEAAVIRQAWRELVRCHFHDAIGGCSSDAVARALAARFDDIDGAIREVVRSSLHLSVGHDPDRARDVGSPGPRLVVWNRAVRPRGGVVRAEVTFFRQDILVGPTGTRRPRRGDGWAPFALVMPRAMGGLAEIPVQVVGVERGVERIDAARHYPDQDEVDRVEIAFALPETIAGLGVRLLELRHGGAAPLESFAAASGRLLWNGRAELGVDRDGTVVLRRPGGGRPFTGLFALESDSDIGDTYTFCPVRGDRVRTPKRGGRVRVRASGPLVAGLDWSLDMRAGAGVRSGPGRVRARLMIDAIGDSPVFRCRIHLDNQARNHRLRLRFPTGLTRLPALAGTQFGVVVRPPTGRPKGRYPIETPVQTAPAHRFVAVARGERGLALFAPGFFEYEWTPRGHLLITLLRSVGELSRSDLTTRPGHAGWPTPTPEAQCLGEEVIDLGIALVTARDLAEPERLEQLWEDAFVPPLATWIRDYCPSAAAPTEMPELELVGEGLVLSACKPAEDGTGVILRCYNVRAEPVEGRLLSSRPLLRAEQVRADERAMRPLRLTEDQRGVGLTVPARGMVSMRLSWINPTGRE